MRRAARAFATIIALMAFEFTGPPADAQPSAPAEITGATYAEMDEATGIWQLRGSPVTVRRGAVTLRAPSITYDTRRQIVRANGGVSYHDESLTLESVEMTVWIQEERLVATDQVRGEQRRGTDRISLHAGRLEAFNKEQRVVLTGSPVIASPDGTLSADRMSLSTEREELLAEGNARVVREDIEGIAPRLLLRRRDGVAVLSGGAVARQGSNEARAETITIDLRQRRFVATGQAHLVIQPGR